MLTFSTENLRNVFAEEDKYKNFKKLCYDLIRGNDIYEYDKDGVEKRVSKAKANEAIRKVFMEVCGLKKEDLQSRKKRRRAEEKHKNEIFEIIEEEIDFRVNEGYQESEWFNALVDERNLALGDAPEFTTESKALFIVGDYSGDNHDITMQQLPAGQAQTLKTSPKTVKIGKDIDLIILGRLDFTDWIEKIAKSYVQYTQAMVCDMAYQAGNKLPAIFKGTGTLAKATKEEFDGKIEMVSAYNGTDVVIMGTKTALKKLNALADVDWASNGQKDSIANTGRLGSYEGTQLIEVPQRVKVGSTTGEMLMSNNILLILPVTEDKFIKFLDEGETEITEVTEKGALVDDFETYEVSRRIGVGVTLGQYFGQWKFQA